MNVFGNSGGQFQEDYAAKLSRLNDNSDDIARLEAELAHEKSIYRELHRPMDRWDVLLFAGVPAALTLFADGKTVMTRAAGGAAEKAASVAVEKFKSR